MKTEINLKQIEKKWQKKWEEAKIFQVDVDKKKKKYYVLEMFPYPSASGLHMGHALNYIIGDVFARFMVMRGFNVLHPMGYDALGLPAENAAIKAGVHPEDYTNKAIKNYIKQQKELGISYDWSRIINTADPSYYKWDQWIFLKMFEKGLAYRKKAPVNWCPKCKTVLANEQVVQGKCWRHENTEVEIKHLEQWFFKITDYAEELLSEIDKLNWPQRTKAMQKNWIGKSYGTEILFEIEKPDGSKEKWPIFTTRPDTIFGVTFMVISAQHPRLMELVSEKQKKEVEKFLKKLRSVSEKELEELNKEGIFTGSYAINPLSGDKVPVYAGNFVVADYGSGMVMAVPAHDQRDFEFAKKYEIPIKIVIQPETFELNPEKMIRAYTGEGRLVNSEKFNGISSIEAREIITDELEKRKIGKKTVNYKLRDWLISRQRYWGTPIPIIYCGKCGIVPVPEKELPVKLPRDVKFGKGNPLTTNEKWIRVKCPKCKGDAKRETDTMDTFVNSSWYFLRYCDPKNNKSIFDKKKAKYWCPVDLYIGGAEHACMHLIYFRFYTKFLRDLGLLDFDEPALKLFHQGMLRGEGGIKMSKSKGNVINPDDISKKYGIDTARLFLLSLASPDKDRDWSKKGIEGSLRFIKKVFAFFDNFETKKASKKLESKLNKAIKEITTLFDVFVEESVSRKDAETFLKLLAPFCPHIAEELWEKLGNKDFISLAEWPKADEKKIDEKIEEEEKKIEEIVEDINHIKKMVKGKEFTKVFIYVLPSEKEFFSREKQRIEKRINLKLEIFAVNDKNKYDPTNKSKKAKPGKPAIYIE